MSHNPVDVILEEVVSLVIEHPWLSIDHESFAKAKAAMNGECEPVPAEELPMKRAIVRYPV